MEKTAIGLSKVDDYTYVSDLKSKPPLIAQPLQLNESRGSVENVGSDIDLSQMLMTFDSQLHDSTKLIVEATVMLFRATLKAQQEVVSKKKMERRLSMANNADASISKGLVEAARNVANCVRELCVTADNAIKAKNASAGEASTRDHVISSARLLAQHVTKLSMAASSMAGQISNESLAKIKSGVKNVQSSADGVVKVAEANIKLEEETKSGVEEIQKIMEKGGRSAMVAEMEANVDVMKMEKMLAQARDRLQQMRVAKRLQDQ